MANVLGDPVPTDWAHCSLPDAWPDQLNLRNPFSLLKILARVAGRRFPVKVPHNLVGCENLPDYLLREFHRIPNGNFSNRLSAGYAKAFDLTMLGLTAAARRFAAQKVQGAESALDLGCGNGALAGALHKSGIPDVWGLDVSPYLLKQAGKRWPEVNFIHGLAERTPFTDERFDAVGICFVLHELPQAVSRAVLNEVHRILRPGGRIVIIEPSPLHRNTKGLWTLMKLGGLKALYFRALSLFVYEPYVKEWHATDLDLWFANAGFTLNSDDTQIPFRILSATKESAAIASSF